ncbi:MAG: 2,3,4,5-tetrahydropyridine-2,6-dicarboxylate N-acetyltransferase [Firmicutes bacterium HGW-Firmicutes-11]|jgi:2,3,4,5-tetrahydropyridine-2-carboxylate N-succinyltransferase/tetrahydrodipicolinate N-acetyltransferase|nr:MAG: 2,3,4,5-tetrahydropyridine-2,6-dicarboxylate N-acetyltransferase [Firmicutes bacterium HGW-Firmicutes-11]
MDTKELIEYIRTAEKKTPVKVYLKESNPIPLEGFQTFGCADRVVFGEWDELKLILDAHKNDIEDMVVENDRRNSAIPLLDLKEIHARIEPGALIREGAVIGERAVVMMGALINIGAVVGAGTMIDMGAVLGGRATVGSNCHIGAGAVLAGVIEPASATPVIVGDNVLIGANAVVLEGVRIGQGAVVAAGAIVIEDVPDGAVVAGVPARVIKNREEVAEQKTAVLEALREL